MRRIWGKFEIANLQAYGFDLVKRHKDASGLYTQVRIRPLGVQPNGIA